MRSCCRVSCEFDLFLRSDIVEFVVSLIFEVLLSNFRSFVVDTGYCCFFTLFCLAPTLLTDEVLLYLNVAHRNSHVSSFIKSNYNSLGG